MLCGRAYFDGHPLFLQLASVRLAGDRYPGVDPGQSPDGQLTNRPRMPHDNALGEKEGDAATVRAYQGDPMWGSKLRRDRAMR
jgi:hypothetical protein